MIKSNRIPILITLIYLAFIILLLINDSNCDYMDCFGTGIFVLISLFPSFVITLFGTTLVTTITGTDVNGQHNVYVWLAIPMQILLIYFVSKVIFVRSRKKT